MLRTRMLVTAAILYLLCEPAVNISFASGDQPGAVRQNGLAVGVAVAVTGTVSVEAKPNGVAVDPSARLAFVTNRASNSVSVISPAMARVVVTIPVGEGPGGIAADPSTHRVYVANRDSGTLSVIDEMASQVVATIATGAHPEGVAIDPGTHTVYVANSSSGSVSAIDGETRQTIATVATGSSAQDVAVNLKTHSVYVTNDNPGGSSIVVLSGTTHQKIGGIEIGGAPQFVATDAASDRVYVTDANQQSRSPVGGLAAYMTAAGFGFVTGSTFVRVGDNPLGVAVDPTTQTIYVANSGSNDVSVVDGRRSQVVATVPAGKRPWAVAVDPSTHTVYVTNQDSNSVTIIDGVRQPSSVPHDQRYFAQTGFRVDNDTIWDYYQRRGGLATFGYPTSRTFLFQGFVVQFFQRRVVQLGPSGQARSLNLLDPGLLPYTQFNGSTFPGADSALVSTAPDPANQPAVLAWVQQHAPNTVGSVAVNYYQTFAATVSAQTAFPNGGDPSLLPGVELELWGVPTSGAFVDPNNHNFVYLRWQRGIMHFDAGCNCTQGILLADYLKAILTGQNLPADLAQEAANSPFAQQYDPTQPKWVHNPSLLPNTDLTEAFQPE